MKVTWKGEEGAPDAIELVEPSTGKKYRFRPGKAVDVPNVWGSTLVLGNPFFEGDSKPDTADDAVTAKAAKVKAAEDDLAAAKAKAASAADADKGAAQKSIADAQARVDAAKAA